VLSSTDAAVAADARLLTTGVPDLHLSKACASFGVDFTAAVPHSCMRGLCGQQVMYRRPALCVAVIAFLLHSQADLHSAEVPSVFGINALLCSFYGYEL
jgi:hypothetical protein